MHLSCVQRDEATGALLLAGYSISVPDPVRFLVYVSPVTP